MSYYESPPAYPTNKQPELPVNKHTERQVNKQPIHSAYKHPTHQKTRTNDTSMDTNTVYPGDRTHIGQQLHSTHMRKATNRDPHFYSDHHFDEDRRARKYQSHGADDTSSQRQVTNVCHALHQPFTKCHLFIKPYIETCTLNHNH